MDTLKILSIHYSELDLDLPPAQPIYFDYKLLNRIWEGVLIPEEWTEGNTSPVFSKEDST